jgi:hypothetical protein
MKEMYTNFTMAELKKMLEESVNSYNVAKTLAERTEIKAKIAEIVEACNELSLLTAYSICMEDEKPVVKFASSFYYYDVVSPKYEVQKIEDCGKIKTVEVCSIKEGVKTPNLIKFIEWAKARNKVITAEKDWLVKTANARKTINAEWEKFMKSKDGYKMSKGAVKTALQSAFDALAFIEAKGGSGKNAIIANGDIANLIISTAAQLKVIPDENKKPDFKLSFLGKNWEPLLFNCLYMAVEGKTYEITYGETAIDTETEDAEPVAEEPKAEPTKAGK